MNNVLLVAAEASGSQEALKTAFTTAATEMKEMITMAIPIGVGVLAAAMAVTFGVKFFKRIAGKA